MLHNYTTNEFKNSAIAQNKSDVRTTWSEAKWMTLSTVGIVIAVFGTIAKILGN